MEEQPKNWSEINKDLTNLTKKIKSNLSQDNLVDDLKESLSEIIESTSEIFNGLTNSIESTIKDEDIKRETNDIISNSFNELKKTLLSIQNNISFSNKFEEE
tara:strand:+ start:183 stop:488 length:306 start_codon:yes stop_codon:yes gene_type:complete